jgi:phosphatidylinositol glycan class U
MHAHTHTHTHTQVALFHLIFSIFRPTETLFDANLSLCFLLLCPRSLARMSSVAFLSLCSLGVPVILNVVDHWMWLGPHTGNANYMFFQCLAYNVFLGIILGQLCNACLERDKALRLATKERGTC